MALELPNGDLVATQEVRRSRAILRSRTTCGRDVPKLLARTLHGRKAFHRFVNGFDVDRVDGARRLTLHVDSEPEPAWLDIDELKHEIALAAAAAPDEEWQVRVLGRARRTLLADVATPALGWTAARAVQAQPRVASPVRLRRDGISNGAVDVAVGADGTLVVTAGDVVLEGVGRLVDGGDFGDSYNYAPPAADTLVEEPEDVAVEMRARGPLRGEIAVTRTYRFPLGLEPDGSARTVQTALTPVTTLVELRAGEPFLRLRVESENRSHDHRLRFHVPLARPAASSSAEGQFAVVERALEVEGGHGEIPLATFPARGFVDAGGVAVLLDHVLEYEVVEERAFALTLLRATGLISRNAHPWRDEPAGPEVAIPAAQCHGHWSVSFAIHPHGRSWRDGGVLEQTERYQHPLVAVPGTGSGATATSPTSHSPLEIAGEGVVLSSLRRRGDVLELRVVCEDPEPQRASVRGDFTSARDVDLLGRVGGSLDVEGGRVELALSPWEIRTVQLHA